LKKVNGYWNIRSCTGNKFIKEINPMNTKDLDEKQVISKVEQVINQYYLFMGYIGFANYIEKMSRLKREIRNKEKKKIAVKKQLERIFNNRMIVIDEIHNIRMTEENKNKLVANKLSFLVENVKYMRLLLLSATPMYNTHKEIIWLLNLMNNNDNRSLLKQSDVFHSDGSFKRDNNTGIEIGKQLLIQKATGYVSFVRGENPYTFPYRIFPALFDNTRSFYTSNSSGQMFIRNYPNKQLNGIDISPLQHIDVYLSSVKNTYQKEVYLKMVDVLKTKIDEISSGNENAVENNEDDISVSRPPTKSFSELTTFGYNTIQPLLQSLNIVYPTSNLTKENVSKVIGKKGLLSVVKYEKKNTENKDRINFEYTSQDENKHIFKRSLIKNYSSKINAICNSIENSKGIVLIYSQYIDGGIIPMALALEEMGFRRHGRANFFKKGMVSQDIINNRNMKYSIISGDKTISPNNVKELRDITSNENKNGDKVKVIIISQAGAEGLDFKNIRQIHVMEPWYNMKRIEQIIGRGVRNCSHKLLKFSDRNVQIYLHGTLLEDIYEDQEFECIDLYVYRIAENKAKKMGVVSRVLKETSIDCILNKGQQNFTEEVINKKVELNLSKSDTPNILYRVGDKPYSSTCDYMEKCMYKCYPDSDIVVNDKTYDEAFIIMNNDKIIERIKYAMKEKYVYKKSDLIKEINVKKDYPIVQIDYALSQLIDDDSEFITDVYNRVGRLINIGELYLFQPVEITRNNITMYERTTLPTYKHEEVVYNVPDKFLKKKQTEKQKKLLEKQKKLKLIRNIEESFNIAMYDKITNTIKIKTDDPLKWYKFFSNTRDLILNNPIYSKEFNLDILKAFLVEHMFENLKLEEKLQLINYLYYNGEKKSESLILLKEYLEKNKLYKKNLILFDEKKEEIIVMKKSANKWEESTLLEKERILKSSEFKTIMVDKRLIAKFLGFTQEAIFKVKDMSLKRHIGANCVQSGKRKAIALLNKILGEGKELGFNKIKYEIKNTKTLQVLNICVLQEVILRLYNKKGIHGKKWFMSYMSYVKNEIKKYHH